MQKNTPMTVRQLLTQGDFTIVVPLHSHFRENQLTITSFACRFVDSLFKILRVTKIYNGIISHLHEEFRELRLHF